MILLGNVLDPDDKHLKPLFRKFLERFWRLLVYLGGLTCGVVIMVRATGPLPLSWWVAFAIGAVTTIAGFIGKILRPPEPACPVTPAPGGTIQTRENHITRGKW